MKLLKKIYWLLARIRGKKYFITYLDDLEEDEILVFGHRIYLKKGIERDE